MGSSLVAVIVPDERYQKMGKIDYFAILGKILIMPNMGETGHFGAQNQDLLTFLKIWSLVFSEILPEDRH